MIAQPVLMHNPIKAAAAQQQQAAAATSGFLDLLPIDSSLTALTQNGVGAVGSTASLPQPANKNSKLADSSVANLMPMIAPGPPQAAPISTPPPGQSATPPQSGVAAAAAAPAGAVPTPASAVPTSATTPDSNANASGAAAAAPLSAAQLDARVAAGAAAFTSHPNMTMASVPPHLLQAPDAHDQTAPAGTSAPNADGQKAAPNGAAQLPSTATAAADASATAGTVPRPPVSHPSSSGSFADAVDAAGGAQGAADGSGAPATAATAALAQPPTTIATPQATDATARSVAPYIPVGEQVAISLKQAASANSDEIRIQLKPASLGAIDVKLNVGHDGRVTAVISADRSDTLNMLKQDSGNLQQALRDAGLTADAGSLSFNLRGDGQSFAQNAPQSGSGANAAIAFSNTPSAAAAAPAARQHTGSLDIQV